MNATKVLMIVAGVFLIARLVTKDSAGQTIAGRLAGGQPSSLTGSHAVGQVNAEGTVTAATQTTATQASLPIITSKGGGALNQNQLVFANTLSKLTGLNSAVTKGWVLAEEPASASAAPNGPNNWLNIGDTGSGNYAGGNPAWRNPIAAAHLTANWLKGMSLPGYGPASPGIQAIPATSRQSIATQVYAIQHSGWASGGYPNLPSDVSAFR